MPSIPTTTLLAVLAAAATARATEDAGPPAAAPALASVSPSVAAAVAAPGALAAAGPASLTPVAPSASLDGGGAGIPTVAPERRERRRHVLGLSIDGGVPDFAGVTLLYRPVPYVRLGAGLLYDYAGFGVRGGVSLLPYWFVAPSLNLEAGHFFEANVGQKLSRFVKFDDNVQPLLSHISYTFVNAQLGLELGHPDWFVFFLRAGLTRLWADAPGSSQFQSSDSSATLHDVTLRTQFPSAKLGFMFFFY